MIVKPKVFIRKSETLRQVFIKFKLPKGPFTIRQVEEMVADLQLLVKLAEKE